MKKITSGLLAFTLILGIAALSHAKEAEEKKGPAVYVIGKVTEYKPDKSITIKDEDGKSHTFSISEDTRVFGDIEKGSIVEVDATGTRAYYISSAKETEEKEPEKPKKNVFIIGEVTAYKSGKSITIKEEDGKSHTFEISEDTYIHGDIQKGSNVEVIAVGTKVEYIIIIEDEEEEAPPTEDKPEEESPKK